MKKAWFRIKLFYLLLKISRDPENTTAILTVTECLLALGLIENQIKKLTQNPDLKNIFSEKKLMKPLDLQFLEQHPPGSVGKIFADHMISRNLNPVFYKILKITNKETFLMMRLRETHDLWHIFTGFGTTVPEELGLQAFILAQTYSPLSPFLIAGGLIRSALINPTEAREIINNVCLGWQLGNRAQPIFAIDWENNWNTSLATLRSEYQLVPVGTVN